MSSFYIKILAIIFMLIDHIGIAIFPEFFALRVIGRLAFPLFAYQLAIGAKNSHNLKERIIKLLPFAIISQIPYSIFLVITDVSRDLNVIFTFILSLMIIDVLKSVKSKPISVLLIALIVNLNFFISIDYGIYGVLLPVMFYLTLDHKAIMPFLFFAMILANIILDPVTMHFLAIVTLVDLPIMLSYNGEKGYKSGKFFYLFYPLHFIVLTIIYQLIN